MAERACAWCGASLDGRRSGTIFCTKVCAAASYRDRYPAKVKEINAKNYIKNIEERKEKQRQWNLENKDHRKKRDAKYYIENRDRCIERQRKWNIENAESARAYQLRKRLSNPDLYRARDRRSRRTIAAKLHMQEALQAIPALMAMIEDAMKETTK